MAAVTGVDTEWMEHARCRFPGAYAFWCCNSAKTNESRERRSWAVMECSLCPVQWECTEYAIDTMDLWNICGVAPEDREFLERKRTWRQLLSMAKEAGVPVVELVRNLRRATM